MISPSNYGLTPFEARVLGRLTLGEVVSRSQLMDALYGDRDPEDEPFERTVDVLVCRLRRKLKPNGFAIDNVIGRGWCLRTNRRAA